jgi:uncharacterized protein
VRRAVSRKRFFPRGFVLLCVFAVHAVFALGAQDLPKASGFVNDFAGVMTAADIRAVEDLASVLQEKTGAELAVVTVQSYAPYATLDEFSLALADAWGIGKKGEDTGALLILAVTERRVKIEVGYGLEGAIPDSAAGRILDSAVIPDFRQNNFSAGLLKGAWAIAAAVAREKGIDPGELNIPAGASPRPAAQDAPPDIGGLVWILLLFFLFGGRFFLPMLLGGFLGMGMGGRRSGGFSSGGFGSSRSFRGFGGGGFGGGGASRGF